MATDTHDPLLAKQWSGRLTSSWRCWLVSVRVVLSGGMSSPRMGSGVQMVLSRAVQ